MATGVVLKESTGLCPFPKMATCFHSGFCCSTQTFLLCRSHSYSQTLAERRAWALASLAQVSPGMRTSSASLPSCEALGKCLDASKPLFVHL